MDEKKETLAFGTGFLIVQVTTADSAIPLSGAAVTVFSDGEKPADVLFELQTARDGQTPRVELPAPPRDTSTSPGPLRTPYRTYNLRVSLASYGTVLLQHVPIFDGITAFQPVDLIPIPENGFPGDYTADGPRILEGGENNL